METYRVKGVAVTKYNPRTKSNNPPIIMVHGGEHGSWCWEKWAQFFCSAGYEIHVLNWYNHGDSDKLPEEEFLHRSITEVARQEITYVAAQLEQTPIIIGHSMGGLAAALYASQAPVKKLLLITPVMPSAVHADAVPLPVDATKPFPVLPYPQMKEFFFTTLSDDDAERYYRLLSPESSQAVIEATQWTVDIDVTKITVPTLVLAAEFDRLIPNEPLKRYATLLHADYQLFEGIGHSDILLKEPDWKHAAEYAKTWLTRT
jgi:pimeloyl-ACP methyl ester carboxylesterase